MQAAFTINFKGFPHLDNVNPNIESRYLSRLRWKDDTRLKTKLIKDRKFRHFIRRNDIFSKDATKEKRYDFLDHSFL